VATPSNLSRPGALHPLHAIFLAFPLPLFLGALLSDLAYTSNFQVQWLNFAQWLIAGALLVARIRSASAEKGRRSAYFVALLLTWVIGFINALIHAKDAWASMPAGLYLSVVTTLLALAAAWIGYSGFRAAEVK
jgi:uncharacterized membrane protein